MKDRLAASTALERFRAVITSGLALLTLALALAGLHAIVSYMVVRRTREIGIRMALGERRGAIRARIVGDALRTMGAGLIPGAGASWLLGRWLQSLEIVRADMIGALAAVSAIFVAAAIAAAVGPAWRASRLDAMRALRAD
jgi:ABC-type antimicrobial peptide transport system permease subunit